MRPSRPPGEEASTALFLLANVSMGEGEEKRLKADLAKTKDPMRRLLLAYAMDVRFQYVDYANAFVELYPEGREQELVWKLKTKYVSVPSPLERHLAYLAKDNPKALEKLVSGIPFADGYHAQFLDGAVQEIHRRQPKVVMDALKKANIPPASVGITSDSHQ
jgi:hypothetical protein